MRNHWYTTSKPEDRQGLVCDEKTGANIAVTCDAKDANLVAAAPEMLEALEAAIREVDGFTARTGCPQFATWISDTRHIIAKAKGES